MRITDYEWDQYQDEWYGMSPNSPLVGAYGVVGGKIVRVAYEIDQLINTHCQQTCLKCNGKLEWSEECSFFCTRKECRCDDKDYQSHCDDYQGYYDDRHLLCYCEPCTEHVPDGYHWQCQTIGCCYYYHLEEAWKEQYTGR